MSQRALNGPSRRQTQHKSRVLQPVVALFHAVALAWYSFVWLWHFLSIRARFLPGFRGFGLYFRYLTFYSYTLQLLQLVAASFSHIVQGERRYAWVEETADDLSCAVFGLANVVTCMFYLIDATTKDVVEGGSAVAEQRPPWLGVSVHVINSMVAWLDILLSQPRSFSRRSQLLSIGFAVFYLHWILLCSHINGSFPYPFLNKLPQPQGFLGVAIGGVVLFYCIFQLGKFVMTPIQRYKQQKLA
ncbi:hypothetical protein CVIRNUC_005440 [Coccomyxa viridis]|uniref:Uncharacterized protein n=1 Tax=Coccomyxa viridis TaxID=1274662 RepID=A0AAV1I7N5_9CHLO|nr:hypothetical protein CVIRNUC_005440 [Coccomyxa viridis]